MIGAPNFSYTPRQIGALADAAISGMEKDIAGIVSVPAAQRNFLNTVGAFEDALGRLSDLTQIPSFLALVSPEENIRIASEKLRVRIEKYTAELLTREDIFGAFSEYSGRNERLGQAESRLLAKRMNDFKRNGLGVNAVKKKAIKRILTQLVALSMEFEKNLRNVSDFLEVPEKETAGLPKDYLGRLRRAKKGYVVSLNYPDYNPFMENAESEDARLRLFKLFNNRCAAKNTRLLERAIVLRSKLAGALGYGNYAEYVLSERMVGKKERVDSFLDRLKKRLSEKARLEIKEIRKIRNRRSGAVGAWETAYYFNKLRKLRYSVDHEKIKEYFPLDNVLTGILKTFEPVLGVTFIRSKAAVWHKDVQAYEVVDEKGRVIAYFYLDLFPRAGKYKHSLCSSFREGRRLPDGARVLPVAAIIANFASAAGGLPSLLKFNEVETLFHEFGHVVQLLLAKTDYVRLSPVKAAWDFVEIPSTVFQQWAYEPSVLRRISGHYADPEKKLSMRIIRNLIAAKQIDSGMRYLRMIAISKIDMAYHSARSAVNSAKIYKTIYENVSMVALPGGTRPAAGIGHFMTGYPAGYYSYAWAEVIAADIFGVFKSAGIGNARMGRKYRKLILEPAASRDENEQVRRFLGRPFREKYFLASIGLK